MKISPGKLIKMQGRREGSGFRVVNERLEQIEILDSEEENQPRL